MKKYRNRFGLAHDPLPRNAVGRTYHEHGVEYERLARVFTWLTAEPGLGLLTGAAGVGKTAAMRHLCKQLPRPDFKVLYMCDTATSATAVYRSIAVELGLRPSYQRDVLWRQLKEHLAKMADSDGTIPILIIDEAQHLSDDFLLDLSGFVNYAFDTRDLLTIWLVGLRPLRSRLELNHHSALWSRIIAKQELSSKTRDDLRAIVEEGLRCAGASSEIIAEDAIEVLWRATKGNMRQASQLLRSALGLADDRNQNFVDHATMLAACDRGRNATTPSCDDDSRPRPPIRRRPPKREPGNPRRGSTPAPSGGHQRR